jgi:hypothetical protein
MYFVTAFICLFSGLIGVTIIDTVGAVSSRKFNFKYEYLILLSAALYIYISFVASLEYNYLMAFLINGLIGFYDGTIGLKLSVYYKANGGLSPEKIHEIGKAKLAVMMINISFFFALIGFLVSLV